MEFGLTGTLVACGTSTQDESSADDGPREGAAGAIADASPDRAEIDARPDRTPTDAREPADTSVDAPSDPDAAADADTVADADAGVPLPALPLRTTSRWIVDANGHRFKLASVNWYAVE